MSKSYDGGVTYKCCFDNSPLTKKENYAMEMRSQKAKELAIVATSGLNFPTKSRKYLINLVKEAAIKVKATFIIVAGNTMDGKALELELKARLKRRLVGVSSKHSERVRLDFEAEFIEEYAAQLDEYLPVISGCNWHIVIAEKVFDRPIGVRIMEHVQARRRDVRLIGAKEDGTYDTEPKVPLQYRGFEVIRVIVPRRTPWFYRIVTGFMQRLINSFVPRTNSAKPSLVLVGCTGTAAYLPFYEGVPCVSVPALHKIDQQLSAENMVGCTVIRVVTEDDGRVRVISGTHDFRAAVFAERDVMIPPNAPPVQRAILNSLIRGDASFRSILWWTNENKKRFRRQKDFTEVEIRKGIAELTRQELIVHSEKSNRYAINEEKLQDASVSLSSLHEGGRTIKHLVWSCFHGGAMKTLYFTALRDVPRLAQDVDAIIENGDLIQGIAHQYEYNGELLPSMNGFDKQEILNAHIRATMLLEAFRLRLGKLSKAALNNRERVFKALPPYVYNLGNHPSWNYHNRDALILSLFDEKLRVLMASGIVAICRERNINVSHDEAVALAEKRIIRLGESRMINLDGVLVGIKHPFKGRTLSKSGRIQEVVDFMWKRFPGLEETVTQGSTGFALAYVANFHEAASVHIGKFGRTILGVMTGAYMYDTEFENHVDKVVEYGPAVVEVRLSQEGRLLYSETEFIDRIDDEDRAFVHADRLDSQHVLERSIKLFDRIKLTMPWR